MQYLQRLSAKRGRGDVVSGSCGAWLGATTTRMPTVLALGSLWLLPSCSSAFSTTLNSSGEPEDLEKEQVNI